MSVRVRFAPSPTGLLHVGNVRTALFNWLFARRHQGVFILRIEDTDAARSQQKYEEEICNDLRWLGLEWDEGVGVDGAFGPYRQTERFPSYQETARQLLAAGKAYYCFCSVEELEAVRRRQMAQGKPPQYSGKCRHLDPVESAKRFASGEPASLRFKVGSGRVGFDDLVFGRIEVDCKEIGDFILLRSDGSPQYNFAVVVDDWEMQITHVIRGEGHLSNTHRQMLLYQALEAGPPAFAHLSTILGPDGSKLSKRHGATSIGEFRDHGYLPEGLVNYLALLGWSSPDGEEVLETEQLIRLFDLDRVNKSPAVFDPEKLNYVNRSHLRNESAGRLADLVKPWLRQRGWVETGNDSAQSWWEEVVDLFRKYVDKLEDFAEPMRVLFEFDPARDLSDPEVREILQGDQAVRVLKLFEEELSRRKEITADGYREMVAEIKKRSTAKGKDLFRPLRLGVTGRPSGPELDRLVAILDQGSRLNLPVPVLSPLERVRAVLREQSGKNG